MNRRDLTYKEGSKPLDLIAASKGLLQYITGYKLINYDEIIPTDYYGFLIDINTDGYFEVVSLNIQSIDYSKLDSTRKSYREKFSNKLEEIMDIIQLDSIIE